MIQEHGWGRLSFYPFVLLMYYSYYKIFSFLKNGNQRTSILLLFLVFSTLWCAAISGGIHYFKVLFGAGGKIALCLPYQQKAITQLVMLSTCMLVSVYIVRFRPLCQPYERYYLQTELTPIRMHQLSDKQSSNRFHAANKEIISYLKDKEGELALLGNTPHLIPLAAGKAPVAWTGDYLHGFGQETDYPYYQKSLLYTSLKTRKPRFILAVTSNHEFYRFMEPGYKQEFKVLL